MQNTTPEVRTCQEVKSDDISIPQAVANQYKLQDRPSYDLNSIIEDVGGKPIQTSIKQVIADCNQSTETSVKKKSIAESKRIIEHFKEQLVAYPKYLSYEGSVVLCVILSIEDTNVKIGGLPKVDQDLIMGQLPPNAAIKLSSHEMILSVKFTGTKDFIITYSSVDSNDTHTVDLNFFNAVIHPEKTNDTGLNNDVLIEQDGGKVTVGGSLVLDSNRIKKLVGGNASENNKNDDNELPRRQSVSGRNAFELRNDLISMAIDLLFHNNKTHEISPEKVVSTAKILYTFVENKR